MSEKLIIELTSVQVEELYEALDLAVCVLECEGQGERQQQTLNEFMTLLHDKK